MARDVDLLNPTHCNIQLPMAEHILRQINAHKVKSLSLCLICCHCKAKSYQELMSLQCERKCQKELMLSEGLQTQFSLATPLAILASMTQSPRWSIIIHVPLHKPFSRSTHKLWSSITGLPTFSSISYGGNPDNVNEFKNSMGYVCESSYSAMVSADLYALLFPGKRDITCVFILSTFSFLGVRIAWWAT